MSRTTSGRRTPAGGRTGSPTAPTPSTRSRSCPLAGRAPGRAPAGARRRHAARARWPGWRSAAGADGSSASTRPWAQIDEAAPSGAAGRRTPGPGPAPLPFADGVVRRGGRLPRVRAHRRRRRRHRRGRPGAASPAAASCSSSTTRCSRRPDSGWIDDQILDRRAVLAHRPLPGRGHDRSRRWRRACSCPSSTARCPATSTPWPPTAWSSRRMEEPAPPAGFLARAAEYQRRRHHPPPALPPRREAAVGIDSWATAFLASKRWLRRPFACQEARGAGGTQPRARADGGSAPDDVEPVVAAGWPSPGRHERCSGACR